MSAPDMRQAAVQTDQSQAEVSIREDFSILRDDFASAGEASAAIKRTLKRLGVDPAIVRRVAIASYEAELNLVIHSMGGMLILRVTPQHIHVIANDCGPGIPDVDQALEEGYSTAPESARLLGFGAGMGLSNMRRCSDVFEIRSVMGEGTRVRMTFQI